MKNLTSAGGDVSHEDNMRMMKGYIQREKVKRNQRRISLERKTERAELKAREKKLKKAV